MRLKTDPQTYFCWLTKSRSKQDQKQFGNAIVLAGQVVSTDNISTTNLLKQPPSKSVILLT